MNAHVFILVYLNN